MSFITSKIIITSLFIVLFLYCVYLFIQVNNIHNNQLSTDSVVQSISEHMIIDDKSDIVGLKTGRGDAVYLDMPPSSIHQNTGSVWTRILTPNRIIEIQANLDDVVVDSDVVN